MNLIWFISVKWHEINRKESVALFKSKVQTKVLAECEVSKNIMEDKNISPCHKVRLWQCILLNEVCRLSLTLRPLLVYLKHGPQLNSKSTLKILALETFFPVSLHWRLAIPTHLFQCFGSSLRCLRPIGKSAALPSWYFTTFPMGCKINI